MISGVIDYWKREWLERRFLFFIEAIGTILSLAGAAIVAFMVNHPPMFIAFICYTSGNLFLIWSSYIRKSGWVMFLMLCYTFTNIVGLVKLIVN